MYTSQYLVSHYIVRHYISIRRIGQAKSSINISLKENLMNWKLWRFFGMALTAGFLIGGPTLGASVLKGKTYLFDYGDFQVRVQYLSDDTFRWEQIKGPAVGSFAEEKFHAVEIRPNLYFIS